MTALRHIVGWQQPPRPTDVVPSFDPNTDYDSKVRSVLYDFKHDDDLKSVLATGPNGTAPFLLVGSAVPIGAMSGTVVVAAYEDPAGFIAGHYPGLSASQKAQDTQTIVDLFHSQKFQDAITGAIAKRAKLGPLPANDYGDPVTIYYYDNDRMKRIMYPRASISTLSGMALDPSNRYWWKNNGITTQELSNGTWGDEGVDWNKDIAGNISDITSIIVAIVGAVLLATGVGAAAGAAILAFSAALAAEANMIDAGLTGGDVQKAAMGFINAITKLVGVELPSGVLTTLGKPVLAAAAGLLAQLLPYFGKTQGMGFADAYATIQANLNQFGPVTDTIESVLSNLAGSQASKVLDGGYAAASYSDPHEIQGIIDLLPDADQKTLFQLGATLGMLRKDQQSPNYHYNAVNPLAQSFNRKVSTPNPNVIAVQHSKLTAKQDLLNYIETVLKPRYGL